MISHRCIILGASNVTLAFPLIVQALNASLEEPIAIFAAHGHGRSFSKWSYVLHRGLPSIRDSAIWSDLALQPPAGTTWGLVTDIGNDILYGSTIERLLVDVRICFERLREEEAVIAYVRPPVERLLRLSPRQYLVIKNLLFPGRTRPWSEMQGVIPELDERLLELAESFGAKIISPESDWYGMDPIHIRRSRRPAAWTKILGEWLAPHAVSVTCPPRRFGWHVWTRHPAERSRFSFVKRRNQPVHQFPGGTTLWLY